MRPWKWILIAVVFRLAATRTQLSFWHPDEWFQTVEFSNFLAFGFASQTNEFWLHMRNLTWPWLLSLPLKAAEALFSGDIGARVHAMKLLTAAADLSILWGFSRLLAAESTLSGMWRQGAWALFVLPWFLIPESVRPSQEHLSAIACWWALGFLALRASPPTYFAAGFFTVLTGTFRYPSGLFALGIVAAVMLRAVRERELRRPRLLLAGFVGLMAGFAIGGLADALIYGRPWESFWMYFQYNILTGLSSKLFGSQTAWVYWDYFRGFFRGALIPAGLTLLVLAPVGLVRGVRRAEPWAFASLAYLLGHLVISHKESRFMNPLLVLSLWAAFQGALVLAPVIRENYERAKHPWVLRRAARLILILTLAVNGVLILRALWGETWRGTYNYLKLSNHLSENPACAVVTTQKPVAGLLPWKDPKRVPEPAVGFFPAPAHQPSSESLQSRPLIWIENAHRCMPAERVLLQPRKTESFWTDRGCTILPSGPLAIFPSSWWPMLISKDWVSAPWYSCPSSVLALFPRVETRKVIAHRMRRLRELPPPGLDGEEFLRQAWDGMAPTAPGYHDGTMGDW